MSNIKDNTDWSILDDLKVGDIIVYRPYRKNSFRIDLKGNAIGIFNGFFDCNSNSGYSNCLKCKGRAKIDHMTPMCIGYDMKKCRILQKINIEFLTKEEMEI